jgi:hypothetical protein
MTTMTTKLALAAALSLSMSGTVFAQQPDWSQPGDFYAPGKTIVQQASPQELRQFQEGDFYAPGKTAVQHPSASDLNQFHDGDFYAPNN